MAVTSSEVTNLGRINLAKACINQNESSYDYCCMGVANGSAAATKSDTQLVGNESDYINVSGIYESSYIAKWSHTFSKGDLPSATFGEAGIFKNESELNMLARIVFDEVLLGGPDHLEVIIRVRFPSA